MAKWNIKDKKKMIYHHMSEDPMYYEGDLDTLKEKILETYSDGKLDSKHIKELFGETNNEKPTKNGIALFGGKFQPPHLGHIRTLLCTYEQYDKIYVCVTHGGPYVIPPNESYDIIKETLRYMPKFEVILVEGTIYGLDAFTHMPKFDYFVSGNPRAIEIASELGYKTRFVSRTTGIGYSGRALRKLTKQEDEQ